MIFCESGPGNILNLNPNNFFVDIFEPKRIGQKMFSLMEELYPINRSITGNGVRKTLKIFKKIIDLKIHEVPSGTQVFDWTVPEEWNIYDAYIKDSNGKKIIDLKNSNLHVLNYSTPINEKMSLDDLKPHLFTLKNYPDVIPYRTSYYQKNWGFCLTHKQFSELKNQEYEVVIDSKLENGFLTYGEYYIPGKFDDEILISTYICHPSMCNDNLSGPVLAATLAKSLKNTSLNYSVRFLFIPETIGAITWLSLNKNKIQNIKHGLVATCLGDSGISRYKKSRDGNNKIDYIVEQVLSESGQQYEILDFWPSGSDERQFCSPGFNLPIGSLMRTPYDMFAEYHSSADNLSFMNLNCLSDTFQKYYEIIKKLDEDYENQKLGKKILTYKKSSSDDPVYLNLMPYGEPQLGKRGIYDQIGGVKEQDSLKEKQAVQWILNLSDGTNSLKDIEKRSGLEFKILEKISNLLIEKKLLSKV